MNDDAALAGTRRTLSEWARREGIAILDADAVYSDVPVTRSEFLACADQCTTRRLLLKDVLPAEYARDIEWVLDGLSGDTVTPKGRDLIVQAIIRAVAGMECDREAEARASRSATATAAALAPPAAAGGGGDSDTFGVSRAAGGPITTHLIGGHRWPPFRPTPPEPPRPDPRTPPTVDVHERDRRILTELLQSTPPGMNVVSYISGASHALYLTHEGEGT